MTASLPYKRILLKLSGEVLSSTGRALDVNTLKTIAEEVTEVHNMGVQIGIVLGGGNIFRGLAGATRGMDRATSDYMGMLATSINCLAFQDALENLKVETRVQSAIHMSSIAEPYIKRKATRHLDKNRVVIFACGTGNPFFTTDTAAALRASEVAADVILKATQVEGLFNKDPKKYSDAQIIKKISYLEVIKNNYRLMDVTATSLCMENKMPIVAFNLTVPGNIKRVVMGEEIGTLVT